MNQGSVIDYTKLISQIIINQEYIIGPVAWSEASKIEGLRVDSEKVRVLGDGKSVAESLVNQYATLFGQASIEVCKDAVRDMISSVDKDLVPNILL